MHVTLCVAPLLLSLPPHPVCRSDATAKEGHVNHDVSNVPVEARINPMTE